MCPTHHVKFVKISCLKMKNKNKNYLPLLEIRREEIESVKNRN